MATNEHGNDWSRPLREMAAKVIGSEPDSKRTGAPARPAPAGRVVDCAVYVDGARLPGQPNFAQAYAQANAAEAPAFVWLGLHEPTARQMADIASVAGLDPLAVEDAATGDSRPKIQQHGEVTFLVLRTTGYVEHPDLTETSEVVETGLMMIFVGARFVITVRHGGLGPLSPVRSQLEKQPQWLRQGPWVVAHAICDRLVDSYLEVSSAIEADLDLLEERVFAPHVDSGIASVYQLKRELMEFKRAVAPLQRPLADLVEGKALGSKEIRRYFRDVHDHLIRVTERIAAYDDLLSSILAARLAQITVDQNNDLRKIAAWAAIAAVQTAIAGIYGMNFTFMPETQTRYGYPIVLLVMLSSALVLYRMFRRSGWL